MKSALDKSGTFLLIILTTVLALNASLAAWRGEPRRLPETAAFPTSSSHLDDGTDTLSWDSGSAAYFFSYPDPDDDSLYNVRFLAPDSCKLLGAWYMLYLGEESLYVAPNFAPIVWSMGTDSFPDQILGGDALPWADISAFYPNWFFADLSSFNILLDSAQWFHVGFTAVLEQSSDTIAFLADNGPSPGTPYSGFMWRGDWYTVQYLYGVGYNFFIRALVDLGSAGVQILSPGNMPEAFHLDSPYPNPFNPTTTLRFTVVNAEPVQLTVSDILGRTVTSLINGRMSPGAYSITVDGSSWPSGIYFANLAQGANQQVVKMVLLK
jgi:hypothetical protein